MIRPHHLDGVFLEVGLVDCPVGTDEMICYIQGHNLSKPHQLVFYRGQEDRLHGVYNISFQGAVDSGVLLEQCLVLLEESRYKFYLALFLG